MTPSERDAAILARYRQGDVSYADLAAMYGVTRQRVGQIVKAADPRAAKKVVRARKSKPRPERKPDHRCPVCGRNVYSAGRVTCNLPPPAGQAESCAKVWPRVRRQVDPEQQRRNEVQQAKSILRNPSKYPETRVRWARRTLEAAS